MYKKGTPVWDAVLLSCRPHSKEQGIRFLDVWFIFIYRDNKTQRGRGLGEGSYTALVGLAFYGCAPLSPLFNYRPAGGVIVQ